MEGNNELISHLQKFHQAPFLFVGSGFSIRYLGLDGWEELLRRFALLTSKPFEYYKSKAESNFPRIATEIAKDFHDIWWNSEDYKDSREAYKSCSAESIESALKIEISKYLRNRSGKNTFQESLSQELEILKEAVIDGVVTTNWDLLLEKVFPDYRTFIGQNQLLFSTPQQVGEIYKIHGCCTQPNSLILTEQDYNIFDKRNPYLVAKLLTLFIEHPVIFLGYSLSDQNIVSMLGSVIDCLTTENIGRLQDRLIFVQWKPEAVQFKMQQGIIVTNDKQIPVISIFTDSFIPIYVALQQTRRRFPAKLLRRLKEHIYKLVINNDPKSQLHVLDIDDNIAFEEIDVVFGVGAIQSLANNETPIETMGTIGYRGITRDELLRMMFRSDTPYSPQSMLTETISKLLKHSPYVPIFKFLSEAGYLNSKGDLIDVDLDDRIINEAKRNIEKFRPRQIAKDKLEDIKNSYSGVKDIVNKHSPEQAIIPLTCLEEYQLSTKELHDFIINHLEIIDSCKPNHRTNFAKLICLYDYLKFKRKR